MDKFNFSSPSQVIFGDGVAKEIGTEIKSANLDNPKAMLVTDTGIRGAGLLDQIEASMTQEGIEYFVFDAIEPNPRDTTIHAASEQYHAEKSSVLVAVGGGSVMDAAKAIGVVAAHGGEIADYDGWNLVPGPIAPLFAIPTTAGTASEVTIWSVITNTKTKVKMGIGDVKICPTVALVDPVMTYTLPPGLTAGTGIDALTHAIESYTCKLANPISDALALDAITLIMNHLTQAVADGSDKVAREGMMLGSLIAGISFSNTNVASVHSLAETIGGIYDGPHGTLNAIFLPYVMAYNLEVMPERFEKMAVAMGLEARAEAAVEAVVRLNQELKVPNLGEFGVEKGSAEELGKLTEEHPCTVDNAREITAEEYRRIIEMALDGAPAI